MGGVGWELSKERVRVRGWHGHQGPRAEQMSATTCFLTPVRVLVTPRMQPAEKFMTLEVSCPPSKTAALPPLLPRWLPSLRCFSPLSSLFSTPPLPTLPSTSNLPPDSSDSSHFDQVRFICSANYHTHVSLRGRVEGANNSSRSYRINMSS